MSSAAYQQTWLGLPIGAVKQTLSIWIHGTKTQLSLALGTYLEAVLMVAPSSGSVSSGIPFETFGQHRGDIGCQRQHLGPMAFQPRDRDVRTRGGGVAV
jgi:hypothetical protein